MTKNDRCTHCGRKIDPEKHEFDKDGYPVCRACWEVEEEQLNKEMR